MDNETQPPRQLTDAERMVACLNDSGLTLPEDAASKLDMVKLKAALSEDFAADDLLDNNVLEQWAEYNY